MENTIERLLCSSISKGKEIIAEYEWDFSQPWGMIKRPSLRIHGEEEARIKINVKKI